ncbi:TIGR01777 family oxidoreductase [Cellulomonas soli]|uniref:Epimerase n=1 Tax=Cellulomonas soli TaxID=931535 RepID=A0A512P9N7_9CELL|nr:TIGR01777 family oxidoreductase [Cellulomonas soli]NYI60398.1 hypothetical protein [Cellulomonas soli]GEP67911.1 epimerase [Cellulomonas soli]
MQIVVAGSHGFIGSALVPHLRAAGHEVRRLVRSAPRAADEIAWDPSVGVLDARALSGTDAVINLAGVNVGERRLTDARKREVLSSRLDTTGLLARTLAEGAGPHVLLQASGIGAYGDRGEELLDEHAALGSTYFAGVVRDWEAATAPAEAAGVRVAHLRTSVVLDAHGGALARLLPLVRWGVGGRLGSGRQFWSWITLHDQIRAIEHLLTAPVHGPVNMVAEATRNADLVAALAAAVHRPAIVPVPSWALRTVLGDFSSEILGSVRAVPAALRASGFRADHADIATAAAWVVGEHPHHGR